MFGNIQLLQLICKVSTIDDLCDELYCQALLHEVVISHGALIERALLAFKNDSVNDFNNVLLNRIAGINYRFETVTAVQS